ARLAERAIVYHNHSAGSNFTTSGTASLLTGTLPWTHRAIGPNGTVDKRFISRNLFTAFQDYYRLAYTHNGWANTLLRQFERQMDELIPRGELLLGSTETFIESLFQNDDDIATVSWARGMKIEDEGFAYSLFLSRLHDVLQRGQIASIEAGFPRGIPTTGSDNHFLLEHAVDFLGDLLTTVPQPFLGYFHFLPPHHPYRTAVEFYNHFRDDGYQPPRKAEDVFARRLAVRNPQRDRMAYDEFILYVDREFARFYDALEESGLLRNTWVVFTSDHGEMFERGIIGHSTSVLYEPVVRVPLLIFEPGRTQGVQISTPTSSVDVLPTLAHVTGHVLPEWREGEVLPPFNTSTPDAQRGIHVVRAHNNEPDRPLTQASVTLLRGQYKLHYYFGYQPYGIQDFTRLYDIQSDPEELEDLSGKYPDIAAELLAQTKAKLQEVDRPYLSGG
ncbi:MAG TPA: sulfatase-like hydrolase/transferase, partial [Anaerolineales bacterium]|nr:sulfatase-like hydrolase/transferase [Anaerolineales bacterium]